MKTLLYLIPPECLPLNLEPVNLDEWFLEEVEFYKTFEDFKNAYKPVLQTPERKPEWQFDKGAGYLRLKINAFHNFCNPVWQDFFLD